MLKTLLRSFRASPKTAEQANAKPVLAEIGWHQPLSASNLLNTPLRQQHITTIWQNVSMTPDMFNQLYKKPIEKYAEMVQLLPASESHHHSHIGGMLDHGLEVIAIASRLRQSYILPQNAIPEEQAKQRDIWTAVIIYAALLHDIGKCAVDIEIYLKDGSRWYPWQGIPTQPYNFRYIKGRDYNLHPTLGSFFSHLLIPMAALDWIAPFQNAFSSLLYFISGHTEKAGLLSEIIQKADQMSVTMALGGDLSKLTEKPKTSFAKQLLVALRQVIEGYKFNSQQGGCDGWLTDEGLWVMSKSTADNIRAVLIQQGIAVPSQNGKLFDELQAHKLIDITSDGKAIWSCKVTSNEGWTHDKPFSLLRIPAQVVWENIEQRPQFFAGRVEYESNIKISDALPPAETSPSNDTATNIAQLTEVDTHQTATELSETVLSIDTEPENAALPIRQEDNAFDLVLNLFPVTDKTENTASVETDASTQIVDISQPQPIPQKEEKKLPKRPKQEVKASTETPVVEAEIDANKFLEWIKAGIISGKLFVNRPNAVIHKVEDHLFLVTPSIFKIYLRDVVKRTDTESWELLQKRFQMLGIHRRQHTEDDSRNIWKCSVTGPNKKSELSGFLIQDTQLLIGEKMLLNNQWLTLQGELK